MMDIIYDICLVASVISLNALLWASWYTRYLKPPTTSENVPKTVVKETDEEKAKKEKLAKEWVNMMNYNGNEQGGDD